MHNRFSLSVTLNAVKGLKKIPHCVRNDKFFVQFSDLLIYRYNINVMTTLRLQRIKRDKYGKNCLQKGR